MQALTHLTESGLTPSSSFGLSKQAFQIIVGARESHDVIADEQPTPVALAYAKEVLTKAFEEPFETVGFGPEGIEVGSGRSAVGE